MKSYAELDLREGGHARVDTDTVGLPNGVVVPAGSVGRVMLRSVNHRGQWIVHFDGPDVVARVDEDALGAVR